MKEILEIYGMFSFIAFLFILSCGDDLDLDKELKVKHIPFGIAVLLALPWMIGALLFVGIMEFGERIGDIKITKINRNKNDRH